MSFKQTIISAFAALSLTSVAFASTQSPSPIEIPRISGQITIDAKLDEPQWQNATRVKMNNITRPYDNIPSPVDTEALLMEDGGIFYIAFIAQDPDPSQIRAFLRDRDRSWGDDLVGLKIDSFNDQRTAYRFMVNPLGAQIDGIESEVTKKESDSWDGIWQSAGQINEQGYIVEMALPLRILNFNEDIDVQTWGIELLRMYPREEQLRLSNIHLSRDNNCEICQLATATGFSGAKQGSNLTITPALVVGRTQTLETQDDGTTDWITDDRTEPSLDVRWGITPDILLNATLNPDFSTVETDQARLNINNTFALRFEEKRPFFLDNQDYFDSNYNLVYTRNINAPNYGAKLTGRKEDHSFGLFMTDDKSTNILIPGNRSSSIAEIEGESKAAALRYRYNLNPNITLGWVSTARSAEDYQNQVHAFDARFRLNTNNVFKFQTLYSQTLYPEDLFKQFCNDDSENGCEQPPTEPCTYAECDYNERVLRTQKDDTFSGNAFTAGYYYNDSDWHYRMTYRQNDSDFRADLGFISQVDYAKVEIGGDRKWYAQPGQWWTKLKVYSNWDKTENDAGEFIEEEIEFGVHLDAKYRSHVILGFETKDKVGSRIDASSLAIDDNTDVFDITRYRIRGGIKPLIGLNFNADLSFGDTIDYASNRAGDSTNFTPSIGWNVNRHLELKIKQIYSDLRADGADVFTARLTDLRTTFQFSVQSFVRFSFIYNNTDRNPYNYIYVNPADISAKTRDVSTELLYGYKINPQTVVYLGYSDHHDTELAFADLEQDQRNVFAKFSYAWVK
ncbi:carbohydrate binding family 9 domain-containing protein [Thalassotalea agarivorans]|uniref:Carbohydrate family 9 binding domain-like n=1 Tax=Thalassotalea agarivorans TaxID=349064 RepID=A0A1I0FHF5_THASX|nr:carbohydrate binding family 9 domain-containing protein [Thalassotalea agarivorans]SET57663.1 Carbohydrate family 9 binding domain-like [Thalassotalea agarivorans]